MAQGRLFPELERIREVSLAIGIGISRLAFEQGLAGIDEPEDLREHIATHMYEPNYDSPATDSQWSVFPPALDAGHEQVLR